MEVQPLFAAAIEHHRAGRCSEAEPLYREVLARRPDLAEAHYNLSIALSDQGRSGEAIGFLRCAVICRPDYGDAHNNLGIALQRQGRLGEAVAAFGRALGRDPLQAEAHNNLGIALQGLDLLDRAAVCYRAAACCAPDLTSAHLNLGIAFQAQGAPEAAQVCLTRAVCAGPDHARALSRLVLQSMTLCNWRDLAARQQRVLDFVRRGQAGTDPFSLLLLPSTLADQAACAASVARQATSAAPPPARPTRSEGGKIRLGYLSADYRDHATAYLIAELIERHDRARFDVAGYSIGPGRDDAMRRRLVGAFDRFVDLRALPYQDAAAVIQKDGIDILVDLKGYTDQARPEILACRPAPLQVNFLGYPGTLGADFIDYIIADRVCLPPGEEGFYREKVVRLPHSYQPNGSIRLPARPVPPRAACGLPEQGFAFCCFNNSFKLTPLLFDLWMRLLAGVPGSVLWLLDANDTAKINLRHEAAARSIDPDRLIFAPRLPLADHLARHGAADLFLDTLPYNAHTTASDALRAGLPVLTCAGPTFAGRVAASLLQAIGLPELIAATLTDYEAMALRLARDPAALAALTAKLRTNRASAALFDAPAYAWALEDAYATMWSCRCDGRPAASFDVPAAVRVQSPALGSGEG